ncbi:MAG TPA: retropepsin-like aspartic protease [Myxococcota bacterium]|nr:retropepsin-like aspartic protease [Myxococcota bacterium]
MIRGVPVLWASAFPSGAVAYAALIGLGVARHGEPVAVALASSVLLFGPPFLASVFAAAQRASIFLFAMTLWGCALFFVLPVYFPGERREAITVGLTVLLGGPNRAPIAEALAGRLPEEPTVAVAQLPAARPVVEEALPPGSPLGDHQIALPYDGEGRRLSVPVVFEHEGVQVETYMMLDTGATYTTLPSGVLLRLGRMPPTEAPRLTLNTANGERSAQVVLVDRVWLGDLHLDGVAVTSCEDCASSDNAGLLGLNVAGAYNVTIDADRREVVFSARASFNRRLDVRPFADLHAAFSRYPGGRVEMSLVVGNRADRGIGGGAVQVACGGQSWLVDLDPIAAGGTSELKRRLPSHAFCEPYEMTLDSAWW